MLAQGTHAPLEARPVTPGASPSGKSGCFWPRALPWRARWSSGRGLSALVACHGSAKASLGVGAWRRWEEASGLLAATLE